MFTYTFLKIEFLGSWPSLREITTSSVKPFPYFVKFLFTTKIEKWNNPFLKKGFPSNDVWKLTTSITTVEYLKCGWNSGGDKCAPQKYMK